MSHLVRRRHLLAVMLILALEACAPVMVYPGDATYGMPPLPRIPEGHRPPPGSCRVWFPERPPGQQPPPAPCNKLRTQVPQGAFLVYG